MADDPNANPNGSPPKPRPKPVAFEIEIGDEKNRQVSWPPTDRTLRGRWSRAALGGSVPDERFAHMPDLPGQRIVVNSSAVQKGVGIVDPLNKPEHAKIVAKARQCIKDTFGEDQRPDRDVFLELPKDDAAKWGVIKNWSYWCRRLVDAAQATVVSGTLPSMEEIMALPGKVRFSNFDTSSSVDRFREPPPYMPKSAIEELSKQTGVDYGSD